MPDQIRQIASRLKDLREIAGVAPENLARELGVSAEEYTRYESGDVDIPIGFLYEAATRFNVELTAILTGEDPKLHSYCLVRKGKGVNVDRRNPYKYQSLAYNFIQKKTEPFMVEVTPDVVETPVHLSSHPGQEFNYVIEGTMMIYIDGHQLILNEGDSLYFNSGLSHGMKALNGKPAKFLAMIF
ncbi:MAG: helix-turn-helix transcriptional regulator [Clostridiales bacterium]|nr:helix-turn-helix transcriptional regulator [Clostridiales bacterium]